MANPFLVLGGIAVGIITAAFGVLAVPGWVAAAQDASATNDLASIAIAQGAASSSLGSYSLLTELRSGWVSGKDTGVRVSLGAPAVHVAANAKGTKWAAVSISDSGHILVRTSASPNTFRGNVPLAGPADTPLAGAAIPTGLPAGVTLSGTRAVPTISVAGMGEGYMPENVISDPSFLSESTWTLPPGHSIDPDGAYGDGGSLRIGTISPTGPKVPVLFRTGEYTPVKAGERWRVSGLNKMTADWNGLSSWSKVRVHYDASTYLMAAVASRSVGEWGRVSAEFIIPSGVTEIGVVIGADHTAGTIWWDDIRLEKISG